MSPDRSIRTQLAHDVLAFADLMHDRCVTFAHSPLLRLVDVSRMELNLVRDIPHTLEPSARDEVNQPAAERGRTEFVHEGYDEAE